MISRRLQDLRNSNGYSQEGMAKIGKMTQRTWGNWETEPPSALESLALIARHFQISADYLLGLTEDRIIHKLTVNEVLAELIVVAQKLPEFRKKDLLNLAELFARGKTNDDLIAFEIIIDRVNEFGGEEAKNMLMDLLGGLGFDLDEVGVNGMGSND